MLALGIVPRMMSGPAMIHVGWVEMVSIVSLTVFGVGFLACVPPVLRSLRITPMDALAEE